jgi:hypothetical protein
MAKPTRIPKTDEQHVRDCETHLFFLAEAHRQVYQKIERYKQLASELRILVAERSRGSQPLLIYCMEKFGFSYEVQPSGPPFENRPIDMVGDMNGPVYRQLGEEIRTAGSDEEKLRKLIKKQAQLRRPVPFKEYVNNALAVYIRPKEYSYAELVRAIAQQMGGSHEAGSVDQTLAQMTNLKIGGVESHIVTLVEFANLVESVGMEYLGFMVSNHAYQLKHFEILK